MTSPRILWRECFQKCFVWWFALSLLNPCGIDVDHLLLSPADNREVTGKLLLDIWEKDLDTTKLRGCFTVPRNFVKSELCRILEKCGTLGRRMTTPLTLMSRGTQRICSSLYLFPRGILLAEKNTGVPMSWLGNLLLVEVLPGNY